jgi:hypothetical protein
MTITHELLMGILAALAISGIVGLIKHVITDAGTLARINALEARTTEALHDLRAKIDIGVLPVADEKLRALEVRVRDLERRNHKDEP